jgi:hypothetical protein
VSKRIWSKEKIRKKTDKRRWSSSKKEEKKESARHQEEEHRKLECEIKRRRERTILQRI